MIGNIDSQKNFALKQIVEPNFRVLKRKELGFIYLFR